MIGRTNSLIMKDEIFVDVLGGNTSPGMTYDEVNDIFVPIPLDPELEKLKIIPE